MFIIVAYKDAPELSTSRHTNGSDTELSIEKTLLVNPDCPIRIVLEYIRKKCKLGIFTTFDLCNESGGLLGLFNLNTYAYAKELFEHKRTYYIIVLKTEADKHVTVIPQVSCDNKLYQLLKDRVAKYLATGTVTPTSTLTTTPPGKITPLKAKPSKTKK